MGIITSPVPVSNSNVSAARARKTSAPEVVRALEDLCDEMQTGERIPTRSELMRRFDASERAVLTALDELRRGGRIVSRNGSGTFVAPRPEIQPEENSDRSAPLVPQVIVDSQTVVALARPDNSIFDRAMNLLCHHAAAAGLALACRFLTGDTAAMPVGETTEKPIGYILFRRDLLPLARTLAQAGNRVVAIGSPLANELAEVPNVYGDQETGGYLAMRHLLDLGHRKIALLGDENFLLTRRWQGNLRAIGEARRKGLTVETALLSFDEVAIWRDNPQTIKAYFTASGAPTAIVAWNDHEAVGILGQMLRAGVRVPDDVSLIGYDDLPEGRLLYPALSTIDSAIDQQLRSAMEILTRAAPSPSNASLLVLPTLIRRDSTASPFKQ